MPTVTSPFQACKTIILKPNGVFKAIGEHNNWSWLPFLLLVAAMLTPQYLYFSNVDITWLADQTIASMDAMSPAEENAIRATFSKDFLMGSALVGGIIGIAIVNAVFALYLNVMTRSDDSHIFGFTDWYGFTWWANLPHIFSFLLSVVLILIADSNQISQSVLSPLSLSSLLSIDTASPWFGILNAISLDLVWVIYLTQVGISQWTSFSSQKSLVIATAPLGIIYGVWLLSILLF